MKIEETCWLLKPSFVAAMPGPILFFFLNSYFLSRSRSSRLWRLRQSSLTTVAICPLVVAKAEKKHLGKPFLYEKSLCASLLYMSHHGQASLVTQCHRCVICASSVPCRQSSEKPFSAKAIKFFSFLIFAYRGNNSSWFCIARSPLMCSTGYEHWP